MILSRLHPPSSRGCFPDDAPISILGGLVQIAPKLARALGLAKSQFRRNVP